MKLATSVLEETRLPNRCPQHPNILITATALTYVFIGEGAPDSSYEERANVIVGPYQAPVRISKSSNCRQDKIYFYQTSGSDSYLALLEVDV